MQATYCHAVLEGMHVHVHSYCCHMADMQVACLTTCVMAGGVGTSIPSKSAAQVVLICSRRKLCTERKCMASIRCHIDVLKVMTAVQFQQVVK